MGSMQMEHQRVQHLLRELGKGIEIECQQINANKNFLNNLFFIPIHAGDHTFLISQKIATMEIDHPR